MKKILLSLALSASLLGLSPALAADDGASTVGGGRPIKDELDPATRAAVNKGLGWLAKTVDSPGGISERGGDSAAIVALAGLAFLANGSAPGDGPYGKECDHVLEYILKNCQESGLIASPNYGSPMYGHGFATLFLAEAYGMSQRPDLKEKLQNAVRLIVTTQNNEGGWRYQPLPQDADISVTICQVMALRAARDAGIKVEKEVIDKAIEYVRGCQNPDGGFSYMTGGFGGGQTGSAFPRSAAGVAALYYAGVFEGDDIKRGLAYIRQYKPGVNAGGMGSQHYFYGQYYAVQAMFLAGGDYWAEWYPAIRNDLIAKQTPDGGWTGEVTDDYCTAVALIILQVPNRYLPVFSGKGPGS
jgi:prenyltransferase beta subunit